MIDLHETAILDYLQKRYFRISKESGGCDPFLTVGSSTLDLSDVWPVLVVSSVGLIHPHPHPHPLDKMAAISQTVFSDFFVNEKFCILIKISLKFVPKVPIDYNAALV